jgi:pimeloyl-ACP methyl ester carboxylesterase
VLISRGRPTPFVDENGRPLPGSISEKSFVTINGVRQGMFIRGKNVKNPVLLYLHGGLPDYFLTERYPISFEQDFTVVWWEQRGAGLSYSPGIPRDTITVEQLISDTLSLTDYLQHRFGKLKIYLMAHSGGSFFGLQAAARAANLYYAYVGIAQMVNQLDSERLSYEYMLDRFRQAGNSKMVRKLEAAPVSLNGGTPDAYLALRDRAMHSLGIGTTRDIKSVVRGIILPSLKSRQYTLPEKVNMWRGKFSASVSPLWKEMLTTNLAQNLTELALPIYFLHGVYDYTCSYPLAKRYSEQLKAPLKGFYTFERSAHSPIFEEPEKAGRILRDDVLAGVNNLADQAPDGPGSANR